ncbi:MAG: hypothetical protein A3G25_02805 [Betaproteobacteria bacterium RIFCSPLOWO2_12_FULL_63_13]|nr:MAG: hypothetical protein A3H32_18390 [Betaproteobacteria bacterium RIFCSPLOWO2_02_FULL_63_19]OGA42783.1 MAG: hypothetical protein A3G25_02805 [Betaproteobacteria bacterium RIFCSPLOWO2_12_FULL_63_13]
MHLKPRTASFTFLLGVLVAIAPLSTDTFAPILPSIASAFNADVATVQLTFTSFYLGVACGQLIYGPLSDRYGRRTPLIAGMLLFVAGGLACSLAGSMEVLIAGRFFQALGMSAGPVLARSIVRDLYSWDEAARTLSLMAIVLGLAPILGPPAGTVLLAWAGWTAVFWAIAAVAVALLAAVAFGLPETAPHPRQQSLNPAALMRNFAFLLSERRYTSYLAALLAIQVGIAAFITSSAFVFMRVLGYSAGEYALLFALVAIGHIIGAIASSRLVLRLGIDRMIQTGALLACLSGIAAAALGWARVDHAAAIVAPTFVYMFATAFVMPHATAGALSPFPKIVGAASSLLGFIQFTLGSVTSTVLGALYDGTQRPLTTAIGAMGIVCLLVYLFLIRPLAATDRRN